MHYILFYSTSWRAKRFILVEGPLIDVHETQDHDTITSWMKSLFQTIAEEGADIPKHDNKLLEWYERITLDDDPEFQVTDTMFKSIITNSLPPSWHMFTKPYVHCQTGIPEINYGTHIPASKLIGIVKEEYGHHLSKKINGNTTGNGENTSTVVSTTMFKPKRVPCDKHPLHEQISTNTKWCEQCKHPAHNTQDCCNASTNPCGNCGRYGHLSNKCQKRKNVRSDELSKKKQKNEVSDEGEEVVAVVAPTNDATYPFDLSKDKGEFYNLDVANGTMR